MPRIRNVVYVPVPFDKNSPVYAHLKAEAGHTQKRRNPHVGPYLAKLLESRDDEIYGGGDDLLWRADSAYLASLIETAVQKALVAAIPAILASGQVPQVTREVVGEASEEDMDQEAAAMALALGSFDDDDD